MNPPRLIATSLIIITNIIPLLGVILWDWELRSVLLLYWIENIILGGATILRLLTYSPANSFPIKSKIFLSGFFTVHYGIFCFVHLTFLLALTSADFGSPTSIPDISTIKTGFIYAIISMAIYHLYDYKLLFIDTGKIHQPGIQKKIMTSPYKHIIIIHIAILFGAFIAILWKSSIAILLIIIIGKTLIDLKAKKNKAIEPN